MRKTTMAMGLALAVTAAMAFAAPGGGWGPGSGPGNGPCATAGGGACPGHGPGAGHGPGRGRMGGGPGFGAYGGMMTEQERAEHRDRMQSFTTLAQCDAYWTEHRAQMTARAQERGLTPGPGPAVSPCERMANRGRLAR